MSSAAPVSDPNALTPQEIAEFEAQEKVDAAAQTNAVAPPAPVTPPTTPAPVAEPTPAPVVPAETVPQPDAPLTPQEIAEFEAQEKADTAAQPVTAAEGLTAAELAELAVQDPTFSLEAEFRRMGPRSDTASLAESQKYNAMFEKFAEADHLVRERGFKWEDRPSVGEVGSALKGFGVGVWKYAKPFLASMTQNIPDKKVADENVRGIAESGAATEASIGGLVDIARKAGGAGMRQIGLSKPLPEWTLEDKTKEFAKKLKRGEATEQVLKGQGPGMQAIGEHVIADLAAKGLPIRPEEVAEKTAGDPFALWAFGAGMRGAGSIVPRFAKDALARGEQALARVAPKIVGKTIETVADITAGGAKVVEKTAPTVGAVVGAVKGAEIGGLPGAVIGAGAGRTGGVAAAKGATAVRGIAERVSGIGEQVSGKVPMVSDYAQLIRSASQAIPGATRAAGEGLAFDVGLAAISSESPEDTKGAIGLGTALGVLGGAGHTARHIVSGQVVGPRAYGIATPTPTSAQANPLFKAMHDAAFRAMTPSERANVNATRKLMQGVAPNADFFVGRDAAEVEAALVQAGVTPARAKLLSEAEGFFSLSLPGKDGNPRRTFIARNVAAAPHEAFHVIQDVLGESGNRALDELVKREYADQWDQEGQAYADRLPGEKVEGQSWEERILNASGWGRAELVDKMTRELSASNEAQGNPPNPELIKRLVIQEIARLEAEKGGDPNNVWNGELSAEEAKIVADRYVARELAAENFDVALKNRGIGLQAGTSLPQRFARIVSAVISGLGGDPLGGSASEIGRIQPKIGVMEAVSKTAREQLPAPKPGEPLVTPKTPPSTPSAGKPGAPGKGIPTTPEQIAEAAADAQQVADAAPDVVLPGASASPRELLGTVAEAIANRSGVKINYLSAPGEPAAATTSNRSARRAVVEAFRSMPAAARALWEKNFFPERVIALKGGKYQVLGWSPEAFAANAHKMAKALIDSRQGDLAPYPLDPTTGSFTAEGWQRLYEDTQTFVENQSAGRTGSGVELVVPREVVEAGGYKPPVRGEAKPLEQGAADFINMLFGFKLPETPRMVVGKRPLNIQGQEVSAATIPGRVEPTTRPRAPFTGQEAEAQGIAGREIQEVNPTRGAIERALGDTMPSMTEAIQRLNLENINDVVATPEQPQFRANTLTVTAGLQPRGKGYAADEMWLGRDKLNEAPLGHKKWAEQNFPEPPFDPAAPQLTPYERAQTGGYLRVLKGMGTLMVDASPKYPTWDKVPRGFKSALEARAVDQDLRVTFDGREVIKKFRPGDGDAQFQPKRKGKDDPHKLLPAGTSGFSKAWILPDGQPVQLGSQWHHHWLDDNPDVAKKYGLTVPPFEGADSEGVREGALKKGFARVNYARNTGALVVEARKKDWRRVKESIRSMVESNIDAIDNISVHLLNDSATKAVESSIQPMHDLSPAEKLENIPFISEGGGHRGQEGRGVLSQFQPSKEPRAVKSAAARSEESGKIFEGLAHWEAYDAASAARDDNVLTDGFVTNEGEFLDRNQAYERALELKQIAAHTQMTQSPTTGNLESAVFKQNQAANTNRWRDRTVKESVDDVLAMSAPDFNQFMRDYKGVHASSATGIAIDIGRKAHGPEDILALKVAADMAGERYKEARAAGDLDTAMAEAMRKQTFEEAVQAAERSRPAINELMSKSQFQAPKDEELAKIRSGESTGNTFTPSGEVWDPTDKKVDIVTLANTNIPRDELTPERFVEITAPYAEVLKHPEVVTGVFTFEQDKKPMASVDVNVVVSQEFRENTKKFAAANQQISFWDSLKSEQVETGGSGEAVLKTPEEVAAVIENLVAGKPVDFPAQFMPPGGKGYVGEEMWLGRDKLHSAPDGHKQWADDKFPGGPEDSGAYHAPYDRANAAGYLRVMRVEDTLSVTPSTKYKNWGDVPRAYKEHLEDYAADQNLRVKFGGSVVMEKGWTGHEPEAQFQLGEPTSTQPKTEAGKALLKKGFGFEFYREENGRRTISLSHKGKANAATINTSLGMEGEADLNWVFVDADLRKQGVGEALYREMATMLKKDGVTKIIGDPISDAPGGIRRRVFGEPKVSGRPGSPTFTSKIDPAAQYQPQTQSGMELVKKGFRMTETYEGNLGELVVNKGGRAVGYLSWRVHPPEMKSAHVSLINVDNDFRRQGIAETLYREVASRLQKLGITRLRGSVIAPGPVQAREKVFGEPEELSSISGGVQHVSSRIDPNAQYQSIAAEDVVPSMPSSAPKVSISSRDEEE